MSNPGETVPPSYLDGIMSMEFNECSIVAAETAALSRDILINMRPKPITVDVIEPYDESPDRTRKPITIKAVKVLDLDYSHPLVSGHSQIVGLYMHNNALRGGNDPNPRLLMKFNDDLAIPVASFAYRADGSCSYIQYGSEMDQDTMVVTPKDGRTELTGAVRTLLNETLTIDSLLRDSRVAGEYDYLHQSAFNSLRELLDHSLNERAETISQWLPGSISRLAFSIHNQPIEVNEASLHILGRDPEAQSFVVSNIDKTSRYSRREIEFILARQGSIAEKTHAIRKASRKPRIKTQGDVHLLARVRGNATLPILRFTPEGGVYDINDDPVVSVDKLVTARDLLAYKLYVRKNELLEKGLSDSYFKEETRREPPEWINDKACSFSRDIQGKKLANELVTAQEQVITDLYSIFELKQLDAYLGEAVPEIEKLISTVGRLLVDDQVRIGGVLKQRKIGNTTGNLDMEARLRKVEDGSVHVIIEGRPSALVGKLHRIVFDELIHIIQPNELEPYKASEINNILEQLTTSSTQ